MKIFEIIDEENALEIGCLLYFEKERDFIIELQDYLDEWTAPLLFTSFVKDSVYTIPREISLLWVRERVIPSGRQNIGSILSNHKLKEYDEMKFLELSSGRCSQDSLYIRKIDELPDYVSARREKNLIDCVAIQENRLLCFFADEKVKIVQLSALHQLESVKKVMKNTLLYESCTVGTGGYSVTFNNSIDIPSAVLYETGEEIPLSRRDFISFVQKNVVDTTECCDILACTRQNLSYMMKNKQIEGVKENVRGNLFFKGDVVRNKW